MIFRSLFLFVCFVFGLATMQTFAMTHDEIRSSLSSRNQGIFDSLIVKIQKIEQEKGSDLVMRMVPGLKSLANRSSTRNKLIVLALIKTIEHDQYTCTSVVNKYLNTNNYNPTNTYAALGLNTGDRIILHYIARLTETNMLVETSIPSISQTCGNVPLKEGGIIVTIGKQGTGTFSLLYKQVDQFAWGKVNTLELSASEAFGEFDQTLMKTTTLSELPRKQDGTSYQTRDFVSLDSGERLIIDIDDGTALLTKNHEFAGESITLHTYIMMTKGTVYVPSFAE